MAILVSVMVILVSVFYGARRRQPSYLVAPGLDDFLGAKQGRERVVDKEPSVLSNVDRFCRQPGILSARNVQGSVLDRDGHPLTIRQR